MRHRIFAGILWTFSGASIQGLLRLVLLLLLARLLGPEAFGIVGAALVVIHLALVFSQLGISSALVQRFELEARHVQAAHTLALVSAALVVGSIQLLAPLIAGFFDFDGLTAVLRVLGLVPLLQNLGLVAEGLLRRGLAFPRLAVTSMLSFALGYGVVGIGLAVLGAGLWALVAAHLTETGSRSLMLLATQPHVRRFALDRGALREIASFSGGHTAWRLGQAIAQGIDNVVVGRWLGAEALGLYGRAYQLTSVPAAVLGRGLSAVLFPVMSRVQHDRTRLAAVYGRTMELLAMLTLPTTAAIVVLAPELILVMLGSAWTGVVVPLQFLAPGIFLRLVFQICDSLATSAGAVYAMAWRQGFYATAVCAGAVIGQRWGLPGVSAGVLCALCVHFVLNTQLALRLTSLSVGGLARAHLRGILLGALVGVELWLLVNTLRRAGAPPVLILCVGFLVLAVTALAAVRLKLIGTEGVWLLQSLVGRLPRRLAILSKLLGLPAPAASALHRKRGRGWPSEGGG